MARSTFGGTTADTVAQRVRILGHDVDDYGPATLTVWSAATGGTQYTDLLVNGAASNSVPVDSTGQVPEFQGPDGVTIVWVSAGGARVKMLPSEGPGDSSVAAAVSGGPQTQAALADASVSRTARTKHAPALGLYFPEAEGAVGDGVADDTTALQAAATAAAGRTLHLSPSATYLTDAVNLSADTLVAGGGTLRFKANTAAFALIVAADVAGVIVDGITLDGNVANQTTWNQSRHCIQITGSSSNVTIRECTFLNPIGDGIYVASAAGGTPTGVDIDGNRFVGTNANRNGVTMTACTDSTVRGNYFYKMARDDMPGAIDLEPNATTDTINNVAITGNAFIGGGTPNLQKAVAVNNNVGSAVSGVLISGNVIRDQFKYAIAVFGNNADKTKTVVSIQNNVIRGSFAVTGSAGIIASSYCEVNISGNDIDSTVEYGIKSVGSTFLISGNRVKNCAIYGVDTNSGAVEEGSIVGNFIIDCGTNASAAYGGIHIKASGISVLGNRVTSSATTKTQVGIYIESGTYNLVDGNHFTGLGARAINSPVAPQVFGPSNVYNGSFNSVGGTYPPAAGTWVAGQVIYNPNPAAGSFIGWVCTTAGTPGTWKTFGPISA